MEELFYNKYLKEEILGRGASSEVWRVVDQQTGVTQAIKIYNPAVAIEDDGIELLKHEFALMANINHQNLLRPLFFGINGISPFLVLPYCKNGNLKKKVGKFTDQDGWTLLRDVASGLAYLHKQQPPIIHQDIKPENILIGDDGSYMLTDFGVSAHAKPTMRATISSTLTSAGTMAYMAPEKFGKEKSLIIASDIWSLGAMTYEMLAGEVPFSIGVMEGGALQMNGAEIPYLPEEVDPTLADVVYKCLSKEPWDRPKAAELELFANQMLRGEKVMPPWLEKEPGAKITPDQTPPTPPRPPKKTIVVKDAGPSKAKKWAVIAASVVVLAGVAGGAVAMLSSGEKEQDSQPIVVELTDEQRYDQAVDMLKDPAQAREGFKLLRELSEDKRYEKATFLWSQLLFKSEEEGAYENPRYAQMRVNAGITIDNAEAHRLLERAVSEDYEKANAESRYQLALDFIDNDKRDRSYEKFKTLDCYERAVTLLTEAIAIANGSDQSDLAEKCNDKRMFAQNRIQVLERKNGK